MKNNLLLRIKMRNKMRKVEKDPAAFISRVLHANFAGAEHSMKVEGDFEILNEVFKQTHDELEPLLKADLIDYWEIGENGRTNPKRGNLLR